MRFAFRELPAATGGLLSPRPVVGAWLEGYEYSPLQCLVDTGALRNRFPVAMAELGGIELELDAPTEELWIAGQRVRATYARVSLALGEGADRLSWEPAVWFCDPWPADFGLLGQEGFLDRFRVTISARHECLECHPER